MSATRRRRDADAPARADDDDDDDTVGGASVGARAASGASRGRQARRRAPTPLAAVETSDDDEEDDEDEDDDEAHDGPRRRRRRRNIPFIAATAAVTATALAAVVAQSVSLRSNAYAMASARVSETHVDLAPVTQRLRDIEHAMKKLEQFDAGSKTEMRELRVEMEKHAKSAARAEATAARLADIKPLEAAIATLRDAQGGYVTTESLTSALKSEAALHKEMHAKIDALTKSQSDFAKVAKVEALQKRVEAVATKMEKTATGGGVVKKTSNVSDVDFKALQAAIAALQGEQGNYVTSDTLSAFAAADTATEKQLKTIHDDIAVTNVQLKAMKAELKKSDTSSAKDFAALSSATASGSKDMLAQIGALSSAMDALSKGQNDFARNAQIDELKKQIDALSTSSRTNNPGGFFKRTSAPTASVSSAQITTLQNAIDALQKAQEEFVTTAQLHGIDDAISTMKKNQAEFAKLGDLKKIEARVSATAAPQASDFTSLEKHMTERVDQYMKSMPRTTSKGIFSRGTDASSNLYADRTGRPDYALASGGGRVVAHSAISPFVGRGDGPITAALTYLRSGVHPRSDDWLLTPSLEQPGDCLALHSPTGFIDVRLRQPIKVDAITLEHSDSLVAYDMQSAPKDFGIFGWLSNTKKSKAPKTMLPLGNFSYTVDFGAVQTFDVEAPRVVDHVRLFIKNNHGHKGWTCIYRLRVHGAPLKREP